MSEIKMPKLGLSMREGEVVSWLKQEGDTVIKGEDVVEIQGDKIDSVVQAPSAGVLSAILVAAGETVPVGTVLAHVANSGQGSES